MTPPAPLTLCPRCGHDLEPLPAALGCKACHGVWVVDAEIERRLRERCRTDPGPLVYGDGLGPVLPCPVCWDPMAVRSLEGVTVDRCGRGHGVWFDVDELERAMRTVQARVPAPPPRVLAAEAPRPVAPPPRPSPPRRPPPRPARPAPPPSRDRELGSGMDVLDVLAEIARAVAKALD